jgi:predicted dehydrogenase
MSQTQVRVAVIGYGWWGKTIVATLQESQFIKVEMVASKRI